MWSNEFVKLAKLKEVFKKKLKELDELKRIRFSNPKKIMVFLPGCFDIQHPGHSLLFAWAKSLGDYLVVATNSDASIRKLKGAGRPIISLKERILMLVSNAFVDYVISFNATNVVKLLKALKPQVYVKGPGYVIDSSHLSKKENKSVMNQQERKIVESYGGKIQIMPNSLNRSTTNLLQQIETLFHD